MDYTTTTTIAAPTRDVFDLLIDIAAWPQWTPTMAAIEPHDRGPLEVGSTALVRQPKLRPAVWTIDALEPGQRFSWHTSGRGYRIDADHRLTPTRDETGAEHATMEVTVTMTGPLRRLMWALAGRLIRAYVDTESEGLRRHIETAREGQ